MFNPGTSELELHVRTHLAHLRAEAETARQVARLRAVTRPRQRLAEACRRAITWLRAHRRLRGRPEGRAAGVDRTSQAIR